MAQRKELIAGVALAVLMAAAAPAIAPAPVRAAPVAAASPQQIAFHALQEETAIAGVLADLKAAAPARRLAFRDVQVVDPDAGTVTPGQSVLVGGGRIAWIGPMDREPKAPNVTVIDGAGRYLSPGLADMHIHASSASGWLLNLSVGVTTVRDMDGFPWLLRFRQAVADERVLAPSLVVAGTIINDQPLDGYAVVADSPLDARRIVRQQAACGYDLIKVHNRLAKPTFDAVADEARALGIDLVGHVPHDITLAHALASGRMRTSEHLKGFLLDATLTPNDDEDYAAALKGADVWLTPTLFTGMNYDRAAWARAVLDGPTASYVPRRQREAWRTMLGSPDDEEVALGERFRATQATVMKRLIPLRPRWLAGTDAAGYPFSVMGHALIEELRLLRAAGLTPVEVLRAATAEPARAMRQPDTFGAVRRGLRADLVLLEANPLEDPTAYADNAGVMVRGFWLPRERIDAALARLAAIYSEPDDVRITQEAAAALRDSASARMIEGFVFEPSIIAAAAAAMRKAGLDPTGLSDLGGPTISGPCALSTPG